MSPVLCKNIGVWKIVNDGLSKLLVRALHYGTVWVDNPSPCVVFGVANYSSPIQMIRFICYPAVAEYNLDA